MRTTWEQEAGGGQKSEIFANVGYEWPLESHMKEPLIIKVPVPQIRIAVLFWYPNKSVLRYVLSTIGVGITGNLGKYRNPKYWITFNSTDKKFACRLDFLSFLFS